ncbi:hypothetical protein LCGC14_1395340 [marine sediment metagenome]|uniref:Chromate transporter n=2 Tax=root TaxID=1 RepID=A0A0F9KJM4_9ZZZZ
MSGLHKRYTDVFKTFLTLGLTSFGGPVAHIAYFRKCFVEEKNWLTDTQFSQLLALCHLLPGPSSSQLGFAIGLLRANGIGALLAFIAFTLPSALFLIIFAYSLDTFSADISKKLVHGLSLIAVPVVLDAVIKMARQLTPDWQRLTIAVLSLSAILFINSTYVIFFVIIIGAIGGLFLSTGNAHSKSSFLPVSYSWKTALLLFILFLIFLLLPLLSTNHSQAHFLGLLYQAGASVFGGGHVVLPILESSVVNEGYISNDVFLSGYGAAQLVPGPLFSFAAFIGAYADGSEISIVMALLSLIALFLPGFLLLLIALPFWQTLHSTPLASRLVQGINAAMVGLLAAALYHPIATHALISIQDVIIVSSAFILLYRFKWSPLLIALWCISLTFIVGVFF